MKLFAIIVFTILVLPLFLVGALVFMLGGFLMYGSYAPLVFLNNIGINTEYEIDLFDLSIIERK